MAMIEPLHYGEASATMVNLKNPRLKTIPRRRVPRTCVNVGDLRKVAKARLPRMFFDFLDGAAAAEVTAQANINDFQRWTLSPEILCGVGAPDLKASFLGKQHALPLLLGPIGFAGMFSRDGEVAAAKAASQAGIPICLSTVSISPLETVAAHISGTLYYQLYMFKDRSICEDMLERARSVGVSTLVLTVDSPVTALRERDARNGFRDVENLSLGQLADLLMHPAWCLDMAGGGVPQIGNVQKYGFGESLMAQAPQLGKQIDPLLNWADVSWLRNRWQGSLVIKGIMNARDAMRCVDAGADAIIVSNHGGRQLDGVGSTISALPSIAQATGEKLEIILDGGVRRGSDVVKALALGAHAVALGRAYAFGLAAGGEAGVAQTIDMIRTEMSTILSLMGIADIAALRSRGLDALQASRS